MSGSIPSLLFVCFQMTFAILTAALMIGAFAGRMKFSAMLVFMILWSLCVYSPICHWVWAEGGFFFDMGALDYAGGTVVHINAGISGLVACLVLGKRLGYGREPMSPHNLTFAMLGAAILWIGWFGFNGGSGLAANERAVMAILVTQIAAAAAGISWMLVEWILRGRPSLLGMISGAVGGLVVITPASGFVGPVAALVMGLIGGVACFWGAVFLKRMAGWDDSLDAFGVHGVGGIVGAILTGRLRHERRDGHRHESRHDPGRHPGRERPRHDGLRRARELDPSQDRRPDHGPACLLRRRTHGS